MIIEVPLQPIPAQNLQILLGDQECSLVLATRNDRLFMDLSINQQPIFNGFICMIRTDLKQYRYLHFNGVLFFVDDDARQQNPSYEGLGIRWHLLYDDGAV